MDSELARTLACPRCGTDLLPVPPDAAGPGTAESLQCAEGHRYPVRSGIPRFVESEGYAGSFGFQWNAFARVQLDSQNGTRFTESRFRGVTGWERGELAGRLVLDAGCGAGAFSEIARRYGGRVAALDLSDAVDACRANLAPDPPLVCQASIYEPPFRPGSFDFVYCIGVIQHTPEPLRAIRSLCRLVRPGGRIALWIYEDDWKSYVGSLGFRRLLRPLVNRLPARAQLAFVRALVAAFFPFVWWLKPLGLPGRAAIRMMPVAGAHLLSLPLDRSSFRDWVLLDTFDMYTPAYDQPQRYRDVAETLAAQGFDEIQRRPVGAIGVTARRRP
jgi:SAM-dependent methyltransferase